jgi:flavin reductase (DIM6/NTAB) family NADH-FMN oxidoreductase RutF
MIALPDWPEQTVAILSTTGDDPHAIPVSTAVRRGPQTVVFALGLRRASLTRLQADPRCALTIIAGEDLAFTVHGRASAELLDAIARVTLEVASIQDHMAPAFTISAGVRWRWTADEAAERDARNRALL